MTKTLTTIPQYLIEDALDAAGWDGDYATVGDNTYSGRAMYGMRCASITFNTLPDLARFMFELGVVAHEADDEENLTPLVRALQTDSMGTGLVAYFPGYIFEG